ncbi:HEPN domain-containing protein [Laspinema sp. A4]|uniref:HEPN domain-containing protein n=1 Tax=Laspinema sp. D2d TaxID=2953686 RepID=UPI0021BB794E|nr:HEPN domain-containing protein [Laspinema sp. D2d]MCT7984221.1 HEPN domain-containing protein [Laspinema sp. D2d]
MKTIALMRLKEVEVLINNRQYSGAYYLSGYVIECALKACIARKTQKFDFPDKKTVLDSYTHDLEKLVKVAQLENELKFHLKNPDFNSRWLSVIQWNEESRYQKHSKQKTIDIYQSIKDPTHGVLQWLQQHW